MTFKEFLVEVGNPKSMMQSISPASDAMYKPATTKVPASTMSPGVEGIKGAVKGSPLSPRGNTKSDPPTASTMAPGVKTISAKDLQPSPFVVSYKFAKPQNSDWPKKSEKGNATLKRK